MTRVLVVGAGHNGLVCAARLARAGLEVTVLEQAPRPGGAVASDVHTLPGFVHDACAGFFPMTLASPAFQDLGLIERIRWANPDLAMVHPFADGSAIVLHRDLGATVQSLEEAAPGAGLAWRRLLEPLLAHRGRIIRTVLTDAFPPLRDGLRLALALRRDSIDLARLMLASSATFGREVFGAERPAAWFSGSVLHADLTPGSAGGSALALGLKFLAHAVGWGFPLAGAGQITDALVARLRECGGEVRCDACVEAVSVRGGRVRGVRLRGAGELPADAVVLGVSAGVAAALLPPDALAPRLMRRLSGWRYGLGTFKVDFALDGPVPWRSPQAREAAVVHVGGELPALFRSVHEAGAGRAPSEPALVVGQHSLFDESRAPADRHTLYVYTHVPQVLDVAPEEFADRIEEQLERFAPGFRPLVLGRAVRTPAHLERENPSLVGGDLAGGSCELDQQLIFRPAPELFRGRTPLPGLYMAGASQHPGPGVNGTPGAAAARALLRDRRRASYGIGRRQRG